MATKYCCLCGQEGHDAKNCPWRPREHPMFAEYLEEMKAMPEKKRRAYLEGTWKVEEDKR